jgi:transposase
MIPFPSSVRFYLAAKPVDMRKGHLSLSNLARSVVKEDPLSGHVFIFYNRRRTMLKALWWDRTGWLLVFKRLERGTLKIPSPATPFTPRIEIDSGDFGLLLEGVEMGEHGRGKYWYRSPHVSLASRNTT